MVHVEEVAYLFSQLGMSHSHSHLLLSTPSHLPCVRHIKYSPNCQLSESDLPPLRISTATELELLISSHVSIALNPRLSHNTFFIFYLSYCASMIIYLINIFLLYSSFINKFQHLFYL